MSLIKGISGRFGADTERLFLAMRALALVMVTVYFGVGLAIGRLETDKLHLALCLTAYAALLILPRWRTKIRALPTDWPPWLRQPYPSIALDLVFISLLIVLSKESTSPLHMLYLLLLISAAVRYGRGPLIFTTLGALLLYAEVVHALGGWGQDPLGAIIILGTIITLPFYLDVLLQQLRSARQVAEQASQAKSEFMANMTHDLQTPLAGLLGMNELLRGTRLDREQREYLEAMDKSAQVLLVLISDILDQCRLDVGKMQLNEEPCVPGDLMREVCQAMQPYALRKHLELNCQLDPSLPTRVIADPLRLRQILFNLVANAVKFTDEGEVNVQVRDLIDPEAGHVHRLCLEVNDTGPGIEESELPHLFESFRQLGTAAQGKRQGAGLGTSITRDLTMLMGGRIEVESHVGMGTAFRVWLPLNPADNGLEPSDQSDLPESRPDMTGVNRSVDQDPEAHSSEARCRHRDASREMETMTTRLTNDKRLQPGTEQETAVSVYGAVHGRVLVAEDNRIAAMVVTKLLEQCGCTVTLVQNGAQALEQALTRTFDLALVDLRMPVMDGLEFARSLRRAETRGQHLILVALTADAKDLDQSCLDAGMDDFLTKPVTGEQLATLLMRWCPR